LDWGYHCIADALERKNAILDFDVAAVAEWMAIAGKFLYSGTVDSEEGWALERRRDLGMEERKMNLDRWAFWKRRFEEMSQLSVAATQGAAKAAVRDMKACEADAHGID
jgi:hypothetical protein